MMARIVGATMRADFLLGVPGDSPCRDRLPAFRIGVDFGIGESSSMSLSKPASSFGRRTWAGGDATSSSTGREAAAGATSGTGSGTAAKANSSLGSTANAAARFAFIRLENRDGGGGGGRGGIRNRLTSKQWMFLWRHENSGAWGSISCCHENSGAWRSISCRHENRRAWRLIL